MNARTVRLVAGREIKVQIRGRALWVSTVVVVVAVIALIVIPAELKSGRTTYRVAVGASTAAGGAVAAAAAEARVQVAVVPVAGTAAARDALRPGGGRRAVDVAVVGGATPYVLVDRALPAGSTSTKAVFVAAVAHELAVDGAIRSAGLTSDQARAVRAPPAVLVDHLRPAPGSTAKRAAALAGGILFFVLVMRYGFGLLMGVIHEKSARVVEILLPVVRPVELLTGKVLGSGLIVLGQGLVITVAALIAAEATGSQILAGSGAATIAVALVWIIVGFAFYATLFAAAGSLASKPEDAQSVGLPLQIPLFVGYFVSFSALGSGSVNGLIKVLAYLPPTAPLDMPVVAASGAAGPLQVVVAMLITVAGTVVVARLGATIFARSLLHTGRRLKARDVLRQARRQRRPVRRPALGDG